MKYINASVLYNLINTSLPEIYFKDIDMDQLLDCRGLPVFEDGWLRAFEKFSNLTLTEDQYSIVNMFREESFKKIFYLTENSDLASYVSDDFEVMATYLFSDEEDEWVQKCLINSYANGEIPH